MYTSNADTPAQDFRVVMGVALRGGGYRMAPKIPNGKEVTPFRVSRVAKVCRLCRALHSKLFLTHMPQ